MLPPEDPVLVPLWRRRGTATLDFPPSFSRAASARRVSFDVAVGGEHLRLPGCQNYEFRLCHAPPMQHGLLNFPSRPASALQKCYSEKCATRRELDKASEITVKLQTYRSARSWVRTSDPYRVKVLWASWTAASSLSATSYGSMQTHAKRRNATVKCYIVSALIK
jgi:hypothetical protein